jgi:hypothetical protein
LFTDTEKIPNHNKKHNNLLLRRLKKLKQRATTKQEYLAGFFYYDELIDNDQRSISASSNSFFRTTHLSWMLVSDPKSGTSTRSSFFSAPRPEGLRASARGARLLSARGEELVQSSCRAGGRPGRSSVGGASALSWAGPIEAHGYPAPAVRGDRARRRGRASRGSSAWRPGVASAARRTTVAAHADEGSGMQLMRRE